MVLAAPLAAAGRRKSDLRSCWVAAAPPVANDGLEHCRGLADETSRACAKIPRLPCMIPTLRARQLAHAQAHMTHEWVVTIINGNDEARMKRDYVTTPKPYSRLSHHLSAAHGAPSHISPHDLSKSGFYMGRVKKWTLELATLAVRWRWQGRRGRGTDLSSLASL